MGVTEFAPENAFSRQIHQCWHNADELFTRCPVGFNHLLGEKCFRQDILAPPPTMAISTAPPFHSWDTTVLQTTDLSLSLNNVPDSGPGSEAQPDE